MSMKAIKWALASAVGHSPAKHVLTLLAFNEYDNMLAFASVTTLVHQSGQDRKTVLANLKRLADRGFIEDTGERKGATKSVTVWRLKDPESGPEDGTPSDDDEAGPDSVPDSSPETDTTPTAEAVPVEAGSSTSFDGKQSQIRPEAVPNSPTEPFEPKERTLKTRRGGNSVSLTLVEKTAPNPPEKTDDDAMEKATRLSPDWVLTVGLAKFAMEEIPDWSADDVRRCAEEFKDHWIAVPGKAGLKLDWPATWRNWIRKERKYREQRAQRQPGRSNVHTLRPVASTTTDRDRSKAAAKQLLFGTSMEAIDG